MTKEWIEQKKKEGRKEKSILEMVGGEKYINPHYNIKAEKMNKDEMKNKISMALKDPILQQGFEIICKENAELKERNRELDSMLTGESLVSNWRKENLTKAKELIKKLKALYLYPVITKDDVKQQDEILTEAEQFLNSEVEK